MDSVSVHIVTFNSADDIEACLEAVNNQTHPIDQIVVVDNASNDDTVTIIKKWRDKNIHLPLQIVENKRNNGFAGGHNQAINQTKTDFSLILNPDVSLDPNYIRHILEVMNSSPSTGSATGKLYRDEKGMILDSTGIAIKKNRRAYDRGANEKDEGQWDEHTDLFGVSGAAAVYRRKMIEDISVNGQFFDETFFAYKEDVDVAWRAKLLGWKATFVPRAIALHQRGWKEEKKRSEIPLFIRHHSYINRYYMMVKNEKVSFLILHSPIIIFYEIASFFYAIMKERELLTVWKQMSTFSSMFEKRKQIQSRSIESANNIYRFFKGIW
ncbi:glycosyltransferase family 2 protein [Halalkalibacter flavus]|uniref:glycosyltransferase family 2 protein n=1 Tax=Halalkalibacter flavus TaxID=3090668 RepID=UPI002FCC0562